MEEKALAMAAISRAAPMAGEKEPETQPNRSGQTVLAPFLSLRKNIHCWKTVADSEVLKLIQSGVQPNWERPPLLSCSRRNKSMADIHLATQILQDYQKVGAVTRVNWEGTKHLVPWFVITKQEGSSQKHRLIADCREINAHLKTHNFKLDHIQSIVPFLEKGMWATKIDLKDAYFHLELNDILKPYVGMEVAEEL